MNNKTFISIFTFAVIARIAGIWIPSLWYDENFTLILARLPFEQMITATMGDVHPPLWYLIEWFWVRLIPDHPWALRIPSMIFSALSLIMFHRLMKEILVPQKIQIGAMVLMAVLPMQIWYAQEARMYALLELEVLAALYFALRSNWTGLLITSTAMLYTQNYSVFYLSSIWLVVVLRDILFIRIWKFFGNIFNVDRWKIVTRSMAVAMFLYLPWVKVLSSQMAIIGGRYWIQEQSAGDLLNIVYKLFWASSMPGFAIFSALMVTFMAISIGLLHMVYEKRNFYLLKLIWTVTIMAFGPITMAWIVSALWQPILLHRALIGSSPFLYIVAAWSLGRLFEQEQIKSFRDAVIASALVVPILVSGVGGYYKNIPAMKNDGAVSSLVDALAYVKANWQEGDVIYYTDDGPMVNLSPYAGDLPQYTMAACGSRMNYGPVLGSLSPLTRFAIGVPVAELNEIDFKRAWVFAPRSPLHPICYEEQISPFTQGKPLITVDDNVFISSGMWLVMK